MASPESRHSPNHEKLLEACLLNDPSAIHRVRARARRAAPLPAAACARRP